MGVCCSRKRLEVTSSDIDWINDAWSCEPNSGASNVTEGVLTVWDKNNPEVTNWCAPQDWRVNANYILSLPQGTDSMFTVTATVDFSNATGKDGAINCNMYLCGGYPSTGTWTYGDAYNADKSGNTHSELDLFETGDATDENGVPVLMQVTTHDANGNQSYSYVGFGGVAPALGGATRTMATEAVATEPMTLTWSVYPSDNMTLRVVQGSVDETFDLGFVCMDYDSLKYSSLSCGVNNSFVPTKSPARTAAPPNASDCGCASGPPPGYGDSATSQPRGWWTMSGLSIPNSTTTECAAAWSASSSGTVQPIYGSSVPEGKAAAV